MSIVLKGDREYMFSVDVVKGKVMQISYACTVLWLPYGCVEGCVYKLQIQLIQFFFVAYLLCTKFFIW